MVGMDLSFHGNEESRPDIAFEHKKLRHRYVDVVSIRPEACMQPLINDYFSSLKEASRIPSQQHESSEEDDDYDEMISLPANWCNNCDKKHAYFLSCPLLNPTLVITDSVIDFSSKPANVSIE